MLDNYSHLIIGIKRQIYDGESLVDFFSFCIKKKKRLILKLPTVLYVAILYKLNRLSIEKLYYLVSKLSKVALNNKTNIDNFVNEFWVLDKHKLKKDFLDMINPEDIIITASPDILIKDIAQELKTKNIISSIFNTDTGKIEFLCFRENKVKVFKEKYPTAFIDEFYTDSYSDLPLMKIAKKTYLVKKNNHQNLLNLREQVTIALLFFFNLC